MAWKMLAGFLGLCLLSCFPRDYELQKPLYRPNGQEATLRGSVTFAGKVPPQRQIDMSADPFCAMANPSALPNDLVTTGDKLQDAFVYLESGDTLTQYSFEGSDKRAIMQHKNCFFQPRALGVRVNQSLTIENNDQTSHNTHPLPRQNKEWNQTQRPNSPPIIASFSVSEIIPIKDNHHPWETAVVGVFSHPFFSISDVYGNYEIRGVPPGTYNLMSWHPKLGQQEMQITLTAGEMRRVDFVFGREMR